MKKEGERLLFLVIIIYAERNGADGSVSYKRCGPNDISVQERFGIYLLAANAVNLLVGLI